MPLPGTGDPLCPGLQYKADLTLAFTPGQKLGRQHQAGFGGVENTVVKFVSCPGSLKQSKTGGELFSSSLLNRWHGHRMAGCRIRQHRQILANSALQSVPCQGILMLPEQAMGSQNPLLWGLQHDQVQFLYAVLLEGGLTFGAATNARVSPALLPSLHAFMGSSGSCQHRKDSLVHFWVATLLSVPGPTLAGSRRIRGVWEAARQRWVIRRDKRVPALVTA